MENPAVIVDIKCEAMEVESPNIDLDSWSWNSVSDTVMRKSTT